jgi:hypothetical protein
VDGAHANPSFERRATVQGRTPAARTQGWQARAYLHAKPSTCGNLYAYGSGFAALLAQFPHAQSLPYLPNLARLEWLVHRAYGAADAKPWDPAGLIAVAPESQGEIRFEWAAGYAAFSLMPEDSTVLTVEFKLSLMAPAEGPLLVARASVLKPGRTLTTVMASVYAVNAGQETEVAAFLGTMMCLRGKYDRRASAWGCSCERFVRA